MAAYNKAVSGEIKLIINKINLLEVYYGDYRVHGKDAANNMIDEVKRSPIQIISEIKDDVFAEAGRLKAYYKISLVDSVALAETAISNGILITADHHEFDVIDKNSEVNFLWIR